MGATSTKGLTSIRATILGYLEGGDPAGSATFAQLTEQAASQCPDTQIILAGYRSFSSLPDPQTMLTFRSQGAQLVHNGAAMLSDEVAARVKAVVSSPLASTSVLKYENDANAIQDHVWRPLRWPPFLQHSRAYRRHVLLQHRSHL